MNQYLKTIDKMDRVLKSLVERPELAKNINRKKFRAYKQELLPICNQLKQIDPQVGELMDQFDPERFRRNMYYFKARVMIDKIETILGN
ncbi:hypothetical protein ACFO25_20460 [Paenactinomyces guangxiensis]|uniref:Uncharacterized protein n=1 Tax=Paenactinomyces guangxiensis TaxID=1490290 RepID=A0A7W1WU98_9BACL|nr:hypothetical protein [Paenactinomyces guangxiensis]MBA4496108.1 hypothetical protein [Paenactinomyces guangxiensis]MBH8593196.1 hypothetical protein [Paenactinomyces guangxiensis]